MTRFRVAQVLILLSMATTSTAADIKIEASPPLPVANLVVNPGMEEGRNGRPVGWRFGTAMPENFTTAWREGGRTGKCLWLKAKSGKMSGYWGQSVRVEPGKKYLFMAYYRLGGGRILCYAHARKRLPGGRSVVINERFYAGSFRGHWLSPVFLPPEALAGPDPREWKSFRLKVDVPPPLRAVRLSLGMYFTPGEASFDDVWFGPAETKLSVDVQAGANEAIRRVRINRSATEKPVLDTKPFKSPRPSFHCSLPGQPTRETYTVNVTLWDGRAMSKRYPSEQKK